MNLRSFGVAFIAVSLSIWPTYGVVFSGTGLQWCLTGALTLTSNRRTTERPSKELLRNRLGQFSRIVIFCGFTLLHIKNDSFICTYWCQRGSRILLNWDPSVLIISESQTKNKIEIFSIMTLNNKEYINQSMYLHPALHALSYVLSSEPQTGLYISWHIQGHLPSWATWTPLRCKLCWFIELILNKLGTV